jgi:DNA-binding NarL/FixJ family response regulator
VIKVLAVDDHPAVRTGIEAVLRTEPGLIPVGSCATLADAKHEIERSRPSLVIVDYELQDGNGLDLCLEAAHSGNARTLVYSAYSERVLVAAALLAGADGLLHKSAGAEELCNAIRCAARGIRLFPPVTRDVLEVCGARLDPEDLPILGMLVEGTPRSDIAEVLQLQDQALQRRLEKMVQRLRPATGALRRLPDAS